MINIQRFTFNSFLVNTYLLWDETGEALLVDAACYESSEQEELAEFIKKNKLKLVRNLNTHCHIDHVLGNEFIAEHFGIHPEYHEDSSFYFETAKEIGYSFGFTLGKMPEVRRFLEDGDKITWGNSAL